METSSTSNSSTSPISTTSSSAITVSVDTIPPRTFPFWRLRGRPVEHPCETFPVTSLLPVAPQPIDAPIPTGTAVALDREARFLDRDLIMGGAPWRLLRLPGGSRTVAERWVGGDVVLAGEERFARTLVQRGLLHPYFRHDVDLDDVDVIVPVRDDVASLHSLLTQLGEFHVTVVDDGSTHSAAVNECTQQFNVALVRLIENQGPAAARNAGSRATARPLLWFIDVDVVIDNARDVVERLAAQFEDPLLAAVAPRIRGGAGDSMRDYFEKRFGPLDLGANASLVVPDGLVSYVPSACLLVRRAALGEGFDETLRVGEDVDLVWRLHDQGWLVRYMADVVIVHRTRGTWRNWWDQRVSYGSSSSELAQRHGARLAPLRVDVFTLATWMSLLAKRPLWAARIVHVARRAMRSRLSENVDDVDHVTREVVAKGIVRSGGPLSRALVRTFGPLVLLAALHPRLRRRALLVFVIGTAWRWRRTPFHASDVPLALADDLAYSVGVAHGAWRTKSLRALTPQITKSSLNARELLGLAPRKVD
jgi:mycofactocin glycosyltransferase